MTQPKTSHVVYALIGLIAAAAGLGAANVDTTPIRDFLLWVIASGAGWYASLLFTWAKPRAQALAGNTSWWARQVAWFFASPTPSALIIFCVSSLIATTAHVLIGALDGSPIDQIEASTWAFIASQVRYAWINGFTPPAPKGSGD